MKRIASGLKGTYPVKFSDTEIAFPEKILPILESFGIRGFETVLMEEEERYLRMFPALEEKGAFFTLEKGKTKIPRAIKDYLGIREEGYLIGMSYILELWGPSWEKYKKQQKDFSGTPDIF